MADLRSHVLAPVVGEFELLEIAKMRQQYWVLDWVLAITAAATFGLASTDSWAADLYVNDEYIEEDIDQGITPAERDTLAGDCASAEYETINEALEAALSGDTIILCDCDELAWNNGGDPDLRTYFPAGGDENATILMPEGLDNITIKSAFPDPNPANPSNTLCVVSGTSPAGYQYPVVRVDFTGDGETTTLTLGGGPNDPGKGFFIKNGAAPAEDIYPPFDPSGDSNASRGGGIRVMGKDAIVEVWDCTITENQSFEDGGGAYCHYKSSLSMNNCMITGNSVNGRGGGIYCDPGGTVMLGASTMVDTNDAGLMGGGIFAPEGSIVMLTNTKVCSNTSGWHSKNIWGTFEDLGGNCIAVDCGTATECDTTPNVWNVTVGQSIQAAINAAGPGDTINVAAGTYPEFLDMEGKAISLIALVSGQSIIQAPAIGSPGGGGPDGDGATPCIKFTSGETNLTVIEGFRLEGGTGTPMFADALNPYGLPQGTTVGGGILCYRSNPTIDSCIIRGNGATVGGGVYSGGQSEPILTGPTYLCNNYPNHLFGYVDVVGACESFTCLPDNNFDNIPDSCQGGGVTHPLDTASGPNAIANAIFLADSGDTISLAAGTYLETINPMGKAIQFVGAGPGLTILDGGGANRPIVCVAGETNGTTFSNLTVTGGYAGGNDRFGGGALLYSSSPVFTNVEFTDNRSTDSGGAVFMAYGASPVFTDCTFDDNIADWMGGAIHALAGCRPVFTNTTFNYNQAGLTGGAVCLITALSGTPPSYPEVYPHGLMGNQPDFLNCTFTYNRAYRYGGGVYAGFASPALFDDCTFDNNAGEWGGGGIYVQSVYDYADLNDGRHPSDDVLEDLLPTCCTMALCSAAVSPNQLVATAKRGTTHGGARWPRKKLSDMCSGRQ